jgi:hypothetical protein
MVCKQYGAPYCAQSLNVPRLYIKNWPEDGSLEPKRVADCVLVTTYRGADKSLARPTSRYILFDGENISFDANLVIYINSTNIPPIMTINRIYEHQNLLSL